MILGYRGFAAVMVPSLKERGRTNGWYAAKKAGKRMQDKSLLTETRSAEKEEEEGTWCCFFSFVFVAVVPNTKLAKRSRYLSKTLSDSLMINYKPFWMYLQLILLGLYCYLV